MIAPITYEGEQLASSEVHCTPNGTTQTSVYLSLPQ